MTKKYALIAGVLGALALAAAAIPASATEVDGDEPTPAWCDEHGTTSMAGDGMADHAALHEQMMAGGMEEMTGMDMMTGMDLMTGMNTMNNMRDAGDHGMDGEGAEWMRSMGPGTMPGRP